MPEDAQPNDLRGRNNATGVPFIHPSREISHSRDFPFSGRTSFKRPSDSYAASPAKRRRLDKVDKSRKEIRRELPPGCRKGAAGCHRERKQFIAHEIESLQKSGLGLKVVSHTVADDAVVFICTQLDILNCSLAPNLPVQEKEQQPKVLGSTFVVLHYSTFLIG